MDSENEFSNWVRLYSKKLVGIARMYTPDIPTAEDRVQDAFIKAYKSMDQLYQHDNPFPWLVRIVINECKLAYRKNWREIVTSLFPKRFVRGAEEVCMVKTESTALINIVVSLPDKYKIPIVLYYFEELSVAEIAEVMRINPNTVKTRLARGRERIGIMLQEEEEGEYESRRKIVECQDTSL